MARPGRAYWKGYLRLSLVTIGVEIHNAVETKGDISFNQIHKPSGKRINYTKTVQGIGPVDTQDIVKGYAVDKDTYVTFEPDELDAIKLESKKTIDLVQFVDREEIDQRYFERPYYILPADDMAAEGYLVIREALQKMNKVGLGQVTMSGREYLIAVSPLGQGLSMEILRYARDLRNAEDYFSELPDAEVDQEMVSLAAELIKRKSSKFKPQVFRNHYVEALEDLVKEKMKGRRIITAEEPAPSRGNVINLMDALRKSVQSDTRPGKSPSSGKTAAASKAPAKKRAGRKK